MAYESYCAACTYLKEEVDYNGYFCKIKGKRLHADSAKCNSFCEAYGRTNESRENMYNYFKSSSCFITTVVHNILGNPDNCQVLENFRLFRKNVLQVNPEYAVGLKEYDTIGPKVACCLTHDKDARDMADMTYQLDLLRVHKLYLEGKYREAYDYYCKMTKDLIDYYGLTAEYEELRRTNYGYQEGEFDQRSAGHGRVRKLVPEE